MWRHIITLYLARNANFFTKKLESRSFHSSHNHWANKVDLISLHTSSLKDYLWCRAWPSGKKNHTKLRIPCWTSSKSFGTLDLSSHRIPLPIPMELFIEDLGTSNLSSHRIPRRPPPMELFIEDLGTSNLSSHRIPTPSHGTFHRGLGTLDLSSHRIQSTSHPTKIGTYHGGLCVVEWCMETTAVSPRRTRTSPLSKHALCKFMVHREFWNRHQCPRPPPPQNGILSKTFN